MNVEVIINNKNNINIIIKKVILKIFNIKLIIFKKIICSIKNIKEIKIIIIKIIQQIMK